MLATLKPCAGFNFFEYVPQSIVRSLLLLQFSLVLLARALCAKAQILTIVSFLVCPTTPCRPAKACAKVFFVLGLLSFRPPSYFRLSEEALVVALQAGECANPHGGKPGSRVDARCWSQLLSQLERAARRALLTPAKRELAGWCTGVNQAAEGRWYSVFSIIEEIKPRQKSSKNVVWPNFLVSSFCFRGRGIYTPRTFGFRSSSSDGCLLSPHSAAVQRLKLHGCEDFFF